MAKLFESIGKLGLALAIGGGIVNSALYNGKLINALVVFSFLDRYLDDGYNNTDRLRIKLVNEGEQLCLLKKIHS